MSDPVIFCRKGLEIRRDRISFGGNILNNDLNKTDSDISVQRFAANVIVILLISGVVAAAVLFGCIFGNAYGYMQRIDAEGNEIKYYHVGGKPYNGFKCINGKLYAFDENGEPYSGLTEINGKKYYFNTENDHALKRNGSFSHDGSTYYADSYGNVSKAQKVGLYAAPDGYNYYYTSSGSRACACWIEIDGNNYYFQAVTGRMLVSETAVIDGVRYVFDENGLSTVAS